MRGLIMHACAALLAVAVLGYGVAVRAQEATTGQAAAQVAVPQDSGAKAGETNQVLPGHKLVMTDNEWRIYRQKLWAAQLRGDMKAIYDANGAPSTRYRENTMDRITEKWIYLALGKEFWFENSKLTKTVEFNPGSASALRETPVEPISSR